MKKKNQTTREAAETILAKMNDMVRGRNFAKVVMDERFEKLQSKLNGLGWFGLVRKQNVKGREIRVQLELVDPDSKRAREARKAYVALLCFQHK